MTQKQTENGYKDIDIETFIQIMKEKIRLIIIGGTMQKK